MEVIHVVKSFHQRSVSSMVGEKAVKGPVVGVYSVVGALIIAILGLIIALRVHALRGRVLGILLGCRTSSMAIISPKSTL